MATKLKDGSAILTSAPSASAVLGDNRVDEIWAASFSQKSNVEQSAGRSVGFLRLMSDLLALAASGVVIALIHFAVLKLT